jgi:hypothetical protein
MKRMAGIIVLAIALISTTGLAQESKTIGKYMACENRAGAGFYWVDTTIGKIWWSDMSGKDKNQ